MLRRVKSEIHILSYYAQNGNYAIANEKLFKIIASYILGRFQQKSSFHSSSANAPPCIAKKGAVVEVHDSIRFTERSRSFKRSIPG